MSDFRIDQITNQAGTAGPQIAGITTFSGSSGLVMPSGATEYRGGRGRGVIVGGFLAPAGSNTIQYITISTTGNSQDFGDLTQQVFSSASFASDTRGFRAGGGVAPTNVNNIDYFTISSTGNAFDFGDLTRTLYQGSGLSNRTRGLVYTSAGSPSTQHFLDAVNLSSGGTNAIKFGDVVVYPPNKPRQNMGTLASPTRGVFAGGGFPDVYNIMEYATISTFGNTIDFGDLTHAARSVQGVSNSVRGVFCVSGPPSAINITNYITIASTGDAVTFGNCTTGGGMSSGCASPTRGVFQGLSPGLTLEYITFNTLGNTTDFGDLLTGSVTSDMNACSDAHGGLGD
jgi:hypothetical protein